jgi:hypothetical protein
VNEAVIFLGDLPFSLSIVIKPVPVGYVLRPLARDGTSTWPSRTCEHNLSDFWQSNHGYHT